MIQVIYFEEKYDIKNPWFPQDIAINKLLNITLMVQAQCILLGSCRLYQKVNVLKAACNESSDISWKVLCY